MNELPRGWAKASLSAIASLNMGQSPQGEFTNAEGRGLPLIGGAADYRRSILAPSRYTSAPTKVCSAGDIVLCVRATIGKAAFADREYCLGRGVAGVRSLVDPTWLRWKLVESADDLDAAGVGTTFRQIDKKTLVEWPVLLPPLPEQRRIVAKIANLTGKSKRARDHLDHIPRLVEKYKQAVLDATFATRNDRVPLQTQVVAARGIPYGIVQTGEPFEGGVPTVRCGDIKAFRVGLSSLKRVNPEIEAGYTRTRLQGGEVLIAIRGSVGEICVVPKELNGCNISREVAMIPVCPGIVPEFIMYFLATSEAKRFILGNVKGVAQQGINLRDLKELPTPTGTMEEQREVVQRVEGAFGWIDRLASDATSASKLIDHLDQAILAKAFLGELVPQDPSDEPASVLLERIGAERGAEPKAKRGRKA
ncbi:restriction endonuclease subunit S [Rhizobium laguerreae]|uniref:restriction endonuclease subunit S n=1 Tax=Rhizobium laguerreae TaxID=1076926 RepID=UPI001C90CD85|nr:restriction endonuclease subunit S [Rhizobium laguerreae]MBY3137325.1 hypothetical protein [Rhizobium laguerreae]